MHHRCISDVTRTMFRLFVKYAPSTNKRNMRENTQTQLILELLAQKGMLPSTVPDASHFNIPFSPASRSPQSTGSHSCSCEMAMWRQRFSGEIASHNSGT